MGSGTTSAACPASSIALIVPDAATMVSCGTSKAWPSELTRRIIFASAAADAADAIDWLPMRSMRASVLSMRCEVDARSTYLSLAGAWGAYNIYRYRIGDGGGSGGTNLVRLASLGRSYTYCIQVSRTQDTDNSSNEMEVSLAVVHESLYPPQPPVFAWSKIRLPPSRTDETPYTCSKRCLYTSWAYIPPV